MKRKLKKSLIAVLTLIMIFTGMGGSSALASVTPQATAIVLSEKMEASTLSIIPGEVKHMRVPIKAVSNSIVDPSVTVSASNAPFNLSQPALTKPDQAPASIISILGTTYVDFDIDVKETAKIGTYPITVKVTASYTSNNFEVTPYSLTLTVEVQVMKEKAPSQLSVSEVSAKNAVVGGKTDIMFRVTNEGETTALNSYLNLDFGTSNIAPNYQTAKVKIGDLAPGANQFFVLPVEVLTTATVGLKTITINFSYKDVDGKAGTDSSQIYVNVGQNEKAAELQIDKVSYSGSLRPGAEIVINATLHNYGLTKAENITVKLDEATTGTDGFLRNYYTDSIMVGSVKSDKDIVAKIPVKVSKQAASGNKKLNLILSFEDASGNTFTSTNTIYPEVIGGSSTGESNLVITNVQQLPAQPVAGDSLTVAFDLQNKSQSDITEVKLSLQSLDGTTFIPKESEPYIYVDKIAGGKSKRISLDLTVSDSIAEGLNNLNVKYTYAGNSAGETVTIPIRNVKNDLGSNSKPKLIISNYSVDQEELRAGKNFNFTFSLYNTHSSISAKNITVTLTQADNIFTVTQGSNSFFISNIAPGETIQKTVEMKVKADATTKAYPLKVAVEYEYEGIKPNPETGEVGVTRNEELNLQAVENARPEVNNINVYSWEGNITMGNTATLGFEFYNMGKSQLNNVTVSIEGDFTKADGDMSFIGNVAPGAPYYGEFDVIPNVEGTAKGIMKVSFEDSNGDKVEFTKDFSAEIMPAMVMDPGAMGPEGMDVFNPMPLAKKAILPVWVFIIMELAIFAIFVPVTRKVLITAYKAKLRKKEQEKY